MDTTRRLQALKTIRPWVARMLVVSLLATAGLMGYLLWSSYQDALLLGRTTTRNMAWVLESRLDATLRRVDALLEKRASNLARTPSMMDVAQAPRHQLALTAALQQDLVNFHEVVSLRVFDAQGRLLYNSEPPPWPENDVADRKYFRALKADATLGRVFSEVVYSRFDDQPVFVVAMPIRAATGRFLGVATAAINLSDLSALLRSIELGRDGVISIRRSDDFRLVLRWPPLPDQINTPLAPNHPNRLAVEAGEKTHTSTLHSQSDGTLRIFSLRVLENHPFSVVVGVSVSDALAGWYRRLSIVMIAGTWILLLCLSLFLTLRRRGRELIAAHDSLEKSAAELRDNEQRFRTLFEEAPIGHILTRASDGRFLASNQAYSDLSGYAKEALDKLSSWDLVPDSEGEDEQHGLQILKQTGRFGPVEKHLLHRDGHWVPVRQQSRIVPGWNGEDQILSVVESIAGQKQAEERIHLLANVFQYSGEAILITDRDNRIVDVNTAFTRMTGYGADEVLGKDPKLLASGRNTAREYQVMWRAIKEQGRWQGELWDRHKDGHVYPKWITISTIVDGNGDISHYIASFTDITEHKAAEERIHYIAHHDALTKLPNRLSLQGRLEQALASARREGSHLAVMFVDLDRFKIINDTLGHHVGDDLLVEVAQRLRESVRESDIVARLGGDEFVIAVVGTAVAEAALVATKVLNTLSQPYVMEGTELHSTPSIGISLFPEDGEDVETLMKNADTAMYHAKAMGRNNFQFFHQTMTEMATERLLIETHLRQALARNEFVLHYQPQIDAETHRVVSVEALIRWRHPDRGMMLPFKFIPVAEESGLIGLIGAWGLNEALRQLKQWREAGIDTLRMAVNISASQLRDPLLADHIRDLLAQYGLTGRDLELEITESVAMHDPAKSAALMNQLHALGVELTIDDFGTGYSSLAYLKQLPLDRLKLDRSFVSDIEHDPNDAAICTATISLAHSLNLAVVAEGVETLAQMDYLKRLGCNLLQGYLFSKPLPADKCLPFLRANT
ncbi:hypothetical protein DLREEDagrD3_02320 [Denitratisoma sp. agr-D3]